ncbi:MAG: type II secretion system F family protein [Acidobacteriaceae bacterium]
MLISAFIGVLLFSLLLVLLLLRPKVSEKAIEKRLQVISVPKKDKAGDEPVLAPSGKVSGGLAYQLGEYVQRFHFSEDLKLLILYSGSKATVGSFLVMSFLTAMAAGAAAQIFIGALPLDVAAVFAGAASQWGLLNWKKGRRIHDFNTALPDAIELMARALRAGHSMSSAVEIVAEQSAEPLASEFAIVFQQQKFGIPFRDAILQLGERMPTKDLHFLITAILVQRETGGDLTEILDRTTRVIRERIRIEGEIQTYTAQGRLTGWILGALPVAMLGIINLITPGYSHVLFYDPLGQKLLYAGCALIITGGLIIRKIVNIEV